MKLNFHFYDPIDKRTYHCYCEVKEWESPGEVIKRYTDQGCWFSEDGKKFLMPGHTLIKVEKLK